MLSLLSSRWPLLLSLVVGYLAGSIIEPLPLPLWLRLGLIALVSFLQAALLLLLLSAMGEMFDV